VLAKTPLWTDDYSDLLGALRPFRLVDASAQAATPSRNAAGAPKPR
jgi:hypothetical protein